MFERLKNMFRKGGVKLGMVADYNSIVEHPKIAMSILERERILRNKRFYMQKFEPVTFFDANGFRHTRPFHSINIAKAMSRKLAKLVFNEGCKIITSDKTTQAFLDQVFKNNRFRKNFVEELEAGYAIGGVVLRPYFDASTNKIKIAYCSADNFYPLQSNTNDISEACISSRVLKVEHKATVYYTLLEFHEYQNGDYYISNELYRSEQSDRLGTRVPLNSLEQYADLAEVAKMEGFSRPLFVYIKLAGKNNADLDSPLGAGIIDNAYRQLVDINEKYDQFMLDIQNSQLKIMASDHYFKVRYDKDGLPIRRFNSKSSVYQALKSDEPFIDSFSPSLRSDEYISAINFMLKIAEMQSGFSAGTFSFDGQSVKTATEIVSENAETYSTRADNAEIVEEALKELITTILELGKCYQVYNGRLDVDVSVDFDDGVFESKDAQLDYLTKASTAQLIPKHEAIKRLFDVDDNTANDWLQMIFNENLGMLPDENEHSLSQEIFGSE